MATFEARVEGLTGLSIDGSSSPTTTELTEFLKDGVIDVTERVIALRPQESIYFQRESSTYGTNGLDLGGPRIISVLRENAADGSSDGSTAWRECSQISAGKQSRVVDSTSLEYATKYNPVYIIGNSGINVYPSPDDTNDGYKVYYVNNVPTDKTNEATLTYAHSDIKYFPSDKYYLVILYAAFQSLLNALSAIAIGESIPSWTAPAGFVKPSFSAPSLASVGALTLPSVPVAPSSPSFSTPTIAAITAGTALVGTMPDIASTTISNVGTPPTYTAPTVSGDATELSSMSALDYENTIDRADAADEFDQWFATVGHLIEDEEDVELATAQLQKIRTYVEAYSAQIQNNLNTFNKEDKEYQAKLQEAIQQAQINAQKAQSQAQIDATDAQQETSLLLQKENQEYVSSLQRFSAEIQEYQANVAKDVQEYQQNLEGDLRVWQAERQTDTQKYASDIQNELNEFNKENAKYQAILQEYLQEAQLLDEHESRKIQKYQSEVQTYQADVNKQVQEYTQKFSRYQLELSTVHQAWAKTESDNSAKYQADIQNELNKFNKENVIYQATMQEKIQEAQLLDTHETRKIQKYQAESEVYGAEVNAKVQEWVNEEWTQKFQKYTSDYASKLQTYASDIQNESLKFDKDIQKEAQSHAAAINEVASEIQIDTSEYNWMSQRYAALKGQYDQAFGLMAPRESEKD